MKHTKVHYVIESIAIFGDSWSVCAYEKQSNPQDPTLLSQFVPGTNLPGSEKRSAVTFESLFQQRNITVKNFSVGGSTNYDIVRAIRKHQKKIKYCQTILICQTDPFRDLCIGQSNIVDVHQASLVDVCSDINNLAEQMLKEFYQLLSEIQKEINIPVIIFTGCSKICVKYVSNNLNYISPCWTRIVDTKLYQDSYFDSWDRALNVTDYLVKKFPQNATKLKQSYFQVEHEIYSRSFVWQTNENFGWVHAGPGGYVKMFEQIIQKIGEIHD